MSGVVSYEFFTSRMGTSSSGFTDEGGYYQAFINNTGAESVKGTIVIASNSVDNAVMVAPADSVMPIGVIYENGIANGELVKVVINGKAEVLLKDGDASINGYWCGVSDTDGRMYQSATLPVTFEENNKAIGHSIQALGAGTNILSRVILHFN